MNCVTCGSDDIYAADKCKACFAGNQHVPSAAVWIARLRDAALKIDNNPPHETPKHCLVCKTPNVHSADCPSCQLAKQIDTVVSVLRTWYMFTITYDEAKSLLQVKMQNGLAAWHVSIHAMRILWSLGIVSKDIDNLKIIKRSL